MSEWKTIDSAPCDGTRIILFRDEWAENLCIGFWSIDFIQWQIVGHGSPFVNPTHWMPLPEPPK